jgi:putative phosphoribosyl transferase
MPAGALKEAVRIPIGRVAVDADLHVPERAAGLVVFAHGSGSSRFSSRNVRWPERSNPPASARSSWIC